MQLDVAERGFAYSVDAPLDMRMDPTTGQTAADVLAEYDRDDLARIFRVYGEERFARQNATRIVRRRQEAPLRTSAELVELLYDTIPAGARRTGGHPGKRVFQALRIEVNAELEAVERAAAGYLDLLREGGRAVFMAYHSLEDKLVKRELSARTTSRTPAGLPVELPGHGPEFRQVTRGAEKAGQAEIARYPRSVSVRVRCVQRIDGRSACRARSTPPDPRQISTTAPRPARRPPPALARGGGSGSAAGRSPGPSGVGARSSSRRNG